MLDNVCMCDGNRTYTEVIQWHESMLFRIFFLLRSGTDKVFQILLPSTVINFWNLVPVVLEQRLDQISKLLVKVTESMLLPDTRSCANVGVQ
jgi:hypothetical protein